NRVLSAAEDPQDFDVAAGLEVKERDYRLFWVKGTEDYLHRLRPPRGPVDEGDSAADTGETLARRRVDRFRQWVDTQLYPERQQLADEPDAGEHGDEGEDHEQDGDEMGAEPAAGPSPAEAGTFAQEGVDDAQAQVQMQDGDVEMEDGALYTNDTAAPRTARAMPLAPSPSPSTVQEVPSAESLGPRVIAGRTFDAYTLSEWRSWLAQAARDGTRVPVAIPEAVRLALAQPPDPARLGAEPSYARNYLGRAETPEELLEWFAHNGFLPPAPSVHEEERIKLVRKYGLDDSHTLDAISDICDLARTFFDDDVTVVSTAVTDRFTYLTGISRSPHDHQDWPKLLETLEASWCMCRHGLDAEDDLFVVLDSADDWRVRGNPLFRPESGALRFYASVRVSLPSGPASNDLPPSMIPVGNLCCISKTPHAEITTAQITALRTLGKRVQRDLLVAHENEVQRKSREQASFISSFLQLTLGGTAVSSNHMSASMQAVFGGAGATSTAARNNTAAFGLAAERLCALSSASTAAILDLRGFLPARSSAGVDDLQWQAKRPLVYFHPQASGGMDYDISENPLVVLGHSGIPETAVDRVSALSKDEIDRFELLIRGLRAGETDTLAIRETPLRHLIAEDARKSHIVPIFDHAHALVLLIVVSLEASVDELSEGDSIFFVNVGHVCLSALVKDQDVESDRVRLAFVSSISHALRLPLHGLAGQLELIRGASTGLEDYLQVADVCMESLRDLVDDAVFAYQNNHFLISSAPASSADVVDLSALLQDVTARALQRALQLSFEAEEEARTWEKEVRVIVDIAAREEGWLACAKANDLRRMVGNVVANAYTYTRQGEVRVALDSTGQLVDGQQLVKISVTDTGCGIDRAFLRSGQLFMPFRRADAFTPSAGLGLPIVNLLVAQYGGQIHVTSELGKGTTVNLVLPLTLTPSAPAPALLRCLSEEISVVSKASHTADQQTPDATSPAVITPDAQSPSLPSPAAAGMRGPPGPPLRTDSSSTRPDLSRSVSTASSQAFSIASSTPSRRRRPLRVLGCEDNHIARKLLAALVKQKGYEFCAAPDGQQGVDVFRAGEFRPDVTVMDIGMPVKDGIQASYEIREIEAERGWPRHKIIALTGLSNKVDRVKAMGTIDDWLLKGGNSLRVLTEELARIQLEIDELDDELSA
ncbi:hypothetical protein JCM3770_007199, partial [Rhodotorula araucariae]